MVSSLTHSIPLGETDHTSQRCLILVDTSWVVHRMWHVHKNLSATLSSGKVLPSGHIYGLCRFLKSLTDHNPDADVVLCLDGMATHGKTLCPDYKANRSESSARSAFDDLGVMVEMSVAYPNVSVAFHRELEADEVISYLVHLYRDKYSKTIVYSADGDMLQLLELDGVYVSKEFSGGKLSLVCKDRYMNDSNYVDKFLGCDPSRLPLFRAMVGDSSDNLLGFPRLRRKFAKECAERFESIDALCDSCIQGSDFPDGFIDFLPKLRVNYEIMKLPTTSDLEERGLIPNLYKSVDRVFGDSLVEPLFSLYKLRSVIPNQFSYYEVAPELEFGHLVVRTRINNNWKHPNSFK